MAQKGFKGPLNVFEGHHGISEVVTGHGMNLDKLRQPWKEWTIMYTWIKHYVADGLIQGILEATLKLVNEHKIKAEDVLEVRIRANPHAYENMAIEETRRHPMTTYTADHSSYYCAAVAILDGAMGPAQFTDAKLRDPKVHEMCEKVFVEPDPELVEYNSPGIVEIKTKNGQKYNCTVLQPKGHPMNPMDFSDVERKFRSMASEFMDEGQMKVIIDTVYNLDKVQDISELLKSLIISSHAKTH